MYIKTIIGFSAHMKSGGGGGGGGGGGSNPDIKTFYLTWEEFFNTLPTAILILTTLSTFPVG